MRYTRKMQLSLAVVVVSLLLLPASVVAQAGAAEEPSAPPARTTGNLIQEGLDESGQIRLTVNKSVVITTRVQVKQVSIGQPEVADVNVIGPSSILVTAKKAGTTQLILWDDQNRSQVADVIVEFDLQALQDTLRQMFPGTKIEASALGTAIVLRGQVPNLQVAEQAVAIASPYSERVLNFLEIAGGQQVMLQVRFAEVSRSATSALGVNLAFSDGTSFGASNIGQVSPFRIEGGLVPGEVSPAVTVFGRARIGDTTIDFFINALRQNNLLRILAEPNLIAMSGQEANFLAGGEYPIPVTQGGATGAAGVAITIEYKEFGVRLKMTPVVLGDGNIRLKVAPEVSDLDFTTAVRFGGFVIPGLTTRKLETTIELAEGQTFAIAGLLNNSITGTKDVTPILGDLPIFGPLFRSVRYQRKETELVVLVTPRLIAPMNPDQVPTLPGEHWRDPTEYDLFMNRDIGGEMPPPDNPAAAATRPRTVSDTAPEKRVASRFRGEYGFVPSSEPESDAYGSTAAQE